MESFADWIWTLELCAQKRPITQKYVEIHEEFYPKQEIDIFVATHYLSRENDNSFIALLAFPETITTNTI